jgi:spore germination cell wall hydrolase CwlJ-like protein
MYMPRIAAGLSALLILANCAATPQPPEELSRAAAEPAPPAAASSAPRDVACLAEALYFEARGTGPQGKAAVAQVVLNRAKSPKFPNSVCGVVGDGCQFSYRCDGRPDVLSDATSRGRAYRAAEVALAGAPDLTGGALFFHSARVSPRWFQTRQRVGTFGGNVFYR